MARIPAYRRFPAWLAIAVLMAGAGVPAASADQPGRIAERGADEGSCQIGRADIFQQVSPAVVFISTQRINPYVLHGRIERVVGSGFIFDAKGLILTNYHVVGNAQAIQVTLDNGDVRRGRLVGGDPIFDLAVVALKPSGNDRLPALRLGDSSKVRVGDDVLAIGNPFGLDQTLTQGIVSGLNRILPETPLSLARPLIQTDAPINPGNSGGPLLDLCGRVIGINSEIIQDASNIGFAVPINLVKGALPSLLRDGHIVRPWIGFHGQFVDADLTEILRVPLVPGLMVEVVEPGSPAEKAGIHGGDLDVSIAGNDYLLGGDIVTRINGVRLDSPEALASAMQTLAVGDRIRLELFRDGRRRRVEYRLPERPPLPGDSPGDQPSLDTPNAWRSPASVNGNGAAGTSGD